MVTVYQTLLYRRLAMCSFTGPVEASCQDLFSSKPPYQSAARLWNEFWMEWGFVSQEFFPSVTTTQSLKRAASCRGLDSMCRRPWPSLVLSWKIWDVPLGDLNLSYIPAIRGMFHHGVFLLRHSRVKFFNNLLFLVTLLHTLQPLSISAYLYISHFHKYTPPQCVWGGLFCINACKMISDVFELHFISDCDIEHLFILWTLCAHHSYLNIQ